MIQNSDAKWTYQPPGTSLPATASSSNAAAAAAFLASSSATLPPILDSLLGTRPMTYSSLYTMMAPSFLSTLPPRVHPSPTNALTFPSTVAPPPLPSMAMLPLPSFDPSRVDPLAFSHVAAPAAPLQCPTAVQKLNVKQLLMLQQNLFGYNLIFRNWVYLKISLQFLV
jgi:hypothetical protein